MAKVEILRRTEVPSADLARIGKRDVLILYRVDADPNKVDSVVLPAEASSDQQVQGAIKAKETSKAKGPGQTFEI